MYLQRIYTVHGCGISWDDPVIACYLDLIQIICAICDHVFRTPRQLIVSLLGHCSHPQQFLANTPCAQVYCTCTRTLYNGNHLYLQSSHYL